MRPSDSAFALMTEPLSEESSDLLFAERSWQILEGPSDPSSEEPSDPSSAGPSEPTPEEPSDRISEEASDQAFVSILD